MITGYEGLTYHNTLVDLPTSKSSLHGGNAFRAPGGSRPIEHIPRHDLFGTAIGLPSVGAVVWGVWLGRQSVLAVPRTNPVNAFPEDVGIEEAPLSPKPL